MLRSSILSVVLGLGQEAGDVDRRVEDLLAPVPRPEKELKGFARVSLSPGETNGVEITLNRRSFGYWDPTLKDWTVAHGRYRILVGGSSRNLPLSATVVL